MTDICSGCGKPIATEKQWAAGACGNDMAGNGCDCQQCEAVCWDYGDCAIDAYEEVMAELASLRAVAERHRRLVRTWIDGDGTAGERIMDECVAAGDGEEQAP